MTDLMAIAAARRNNAEEAFQNFEFIDGCSPDETNGWESDGTSELTRTLFIPDGDNPDGPSLKGQFTVSFVPGSAEIDSVWATLDGNDIGRPAPGSASLSGPEW